MEVERKCTHKEDDIRESADEVRVGSMDAKVGERPDEDSLGVGCMVVAGVGSRGFVGEAIAVVGVVGGRMVVGGIVAVEDIGSVGGLAVGADIAVAGLVVGEDTNVGMETDNQAAKAVVDTANAVLKVDMAESWLVLRSVGICLSAGNLAGDVRISYAWSLMSLSAYPKD